MLISYYKENPILLKENGNKTETKKAMEPLIAQFEKPTLRGLHMT